MSFELIDELANANARIVELEKINALLEKQLDDSTKLIDELTTQKYEKTKTHECREKTIQEEIQEDIQYIMAYEKRQQEIQDARDLLERNDHRDVWMANGSSMSASALRQLRASDKRNGNNDYAKAYGPTFKERQGVWHPNDNHHIM